MFWILDYRYGADDGGTQVIGCKNAKEALDTIADLIKANPTQNIEKIMLIEGREVPLYVQLPKPALPKVKIKK